MYSPILGRLPCGGRRPVGFTDVVRRQSRESEADSQIDIGKGAADGIAALEHGHVGTEGCVQGSVSLSGKLLIGQGIREMIVLTRGVNHEVRPEIVKDRKDDIPEDVEVALVRGARGRGILTVLPRAAGPPFSLRKPVPG